MLGDDVASMQRSVKTFILEMHAQCRQMTLDTQSSNMLKLPNRHHRTSKKTSQLNYQEGIMSNEQINTVTLLEIENLVLHKIHKPIMAYITNKMQSECNVRF